MLLLAGSKRGGPTLPPSLIWPRLLSLFATYAWGHIEYFLLNLLDCRS